MNKQLQAILLLPFPVTILIPGMLLFLFNMHIPSIETPRLYIAFFTLLCGLLLAFFTVRLFITRGNGTPAPWNPTQHLICTGIYAYMRNPMISGVCLILLGEMLLFSSWAIGVWLGIFIIVNLFYFPLFEEPGLHKRFGAEYEEYCRNVPRYIPRLTPYHSKQKTN